MSNPTSRRAEDVARVEQEILAFLERQPGTPKTHLVHPIRGQVYGSATVLIRNGQLQQLQEQLYFIADVIEAMAATNRIRRVKQPRKHYFGFHLPEQSAP